MSGLFFSRVGVSILFRVRTRMDGDCRPLILFFQNTRHPVSSRASLHANAACLYLHYVYVSMYACGIYTYTDDYARVLVRKGRKRERERKAIFPD